VEQPSLGIVQQTARAKKKRGQILDLLINFKKTSTMGLDFMRDKGAAFEVRRDASRNQEFDMDLLRNAQPDLSGQIFQCHLTDNGAALVKGLRLLIRVFSESEMKVSQNGQEIGAIQFEAAARLAAFIKSNNVHTGIMTVLLTDLPDISGNFSVRPFKPFKNQ
jgi:hypothetical protein